MEALEREGRDQVRRLAGRNEFGGLLREGTTSGVTVEASGCRADGRIYESDIRRGLIIWNLSDSAVAGAKKLGHSNPQTQETSFPLKTKGN